MSLRLHAYEPHSRANGPGVRAVLWVQGCSLACPGCFNPATHADRGPAPLGTETASVTVDRFAGDDEIEGLTISGGEPFEQAAGLLALVREVRRRTQLSVLVFSGFSLDEICAQPLGHEILEHVDVLIDGRYQSGERKATAMRGSENQHIQCLTGRYTVAEVEATPDAELRIDTHGNVTISGVAPLRIK